MNPIDPRIVEFIMEHHVLALATSANNQAYTASCFYVFLENERLFVFTSDTDTRHGSEMKNNPKVAANIALETTMVGQIQGVQITGNVKLLSGTEHQRARKAYLKKFPVARLSKLNLWGLDPEFIKMTHNRLGFGKKLIWNNVGEMG